ncbi:MAG TPA: 2,3,4,5-tetrahydropyridine-2,6-dicarboxylate N-succinyltransferase, partial [Ilumatobacteraceae bacterium]
MEEERLAWGFGLTTLDANAEVLDAWFPELGFGEMPERSDYSHRPAIRHDDVRGVDIGVVAVRAELDSPPTTATDLYLRLHLLSNRLCKPRTINLDGLFGMLNNVAWTNLGPVPVDEVDAVRWRLRHDGQVLTVHGLDKLPRMTDYVVPSGV